MPSPTFTNDYAPDGKAVREAARAAAGHRCVRCGHPYECGVKREDRGEWSDCDWKCTHGPIVRLRAVGDLAWITVTKEQNLLIPITQYILSGGEVQARWRVLTVHHFDGDKANDAWWNLLPLCQVCHLSFQTRVNPEIPWLFEHSDWLKPFVAGFYAKKYRGLDLTHEQVMNNLAELLFLEQRTS